MTKFSFFGQRGYERFEEDLDGCDDILKGLRRVGQLGLPDEPLPLNLSCHCPSRTKDQRPVGARGIGVFRFSNVFSIASASISPLKLNVRDSLQRS